MYNLFLGNQSTAKHTFIIQIIRILDKLQPYIYKFVLIVLKDFTIVYDYN